MHALTLKEDTKICGVCGQPVHVTVVQRLLSGGAMDLDLRPAPEKRDTLKYQIQLSKLELMHSWMLYQLRVLSFLIS